MSTDAIARDLREDAQYLLPPNHSFSGYNGIGTRMVVAAGAIENLAQERDALQHRVAVLDDAGKHLAEQRDRARALACRLEEELALIRRAATARRHG